jgi:hypothetical protein
MRFARVLPALLQVAAASDAPRDSRAAQAAWPAIAPIDAEVGLDFTSPRQFLQIPLRDRDGRVHYRLTCRGGSPEYMDEVAENTGIMFNGEFGCILTPGEEDSDRSILTEEGIPDYFSRSFFSEANLVGTCAAYPQFGVKRSFRARGMVVTLAFDDLIVSDEAERKRAAARVEGAHAVLHGVFHVSVRPDTSAATARAEQPGFLDPKGDQALCRTPRKGNPMRMCRDQTSAWAECPPGWEYLRFPGEDGPAEASAAGDPK